MVAGIESATVGRWIAADAMQCPSLHNTADGSYARYTAKMRALLVWSRVRIVGSIGLFALFKPVSCSDSDDAYHRPTQDTYEAALVYDRERIRPWHVWYWVPSLIQLGGFALIPFDMSSTLIC